MIPYLPDATSGGPDLSPDDGPMSTPKRRALEKGLPV